MSMVREDEQRERPTESQLDDLAKSLVEAKYAITFQRNKEAADEFSNSNIADGYARYWLDEIIEAMAAADIFLYRQ